MKNNLKQLYSSVLFRLHFNTENFNERFTVKGGVQMVNILKGIITVCARVTPGRIRLICIFIWKVKHLVRSQGSSGATKYLKAVTVSIQQSLGGQVVKDSMKLGARFSRTRTGLPRFLPPQIRTLITSGDPVTMKIVLTLTNVYRVFKFPGLLKISTITAPNKGHGLTDKLIREYIPLFIERFVSPRYPESKIKEMLVKESKAPLQGIFKGGPGVIGAFGEFNSLPRVMLRAYKALMRNPILKESLHILWGYMPPEFGKIVIPNLEHYLKVEADSKFRNVIKPLPYLGKLGLKEEAAGKIRVFAMVDAWTQWTLRPLHDVLFKVLSGIRMDGTFNQTAPLAFLVGKPELYSLDLTAATDRIPISLQRALLGHLVSHEFAGAWANLLVGRTYRLHQGESFKDLSYAVGQPMGALSSWAMLAFVHHFLVQCAAWRAGHPQDRLFLDYAVLGDDLVIADWKVARAYLRLLDSLGVECGLHKSLLSPRGLALEFAKRTLFKGVDVSPIPILEFFTASRNLGACVEFMKKYHVSLTTMLQSLGVGWKVRSWLNKPLGKLPSRVRLLILALNIPTTPEEVTEFFELGKPRVALYANDTKEVISAISKVESKRLISKLLVSSNKAAFDIDPMDWARESAAALVLSVIKYESDSELTLMSSVETLKALIKRGEVKKDDVQYLFRTLSDVLQNLINLTWFSARVNLVEDAKRDIKKLQDLPSENLQSLFMGIVEAQRNVAARSENAFSRSRPNPAQIKGIATPEMVRFWKRWSAVIQGSAKVADKAKQLTESFENKSQKGDS
nr:MAG: putative RNA-dependent RNA polymerase [Mitoviridae sp.]